MEYAGKVAIMHRAVYGGKQVEEISEIHDFLERSI